MDFVYELAAGKYTDRFVTDAGSTFFVKKSAAPELRLKAMQMLLEWGYVKPAQQIELGNTDGSPLQVVVTNYSSEAKEPVHQTKRPL